MRFLIPAAIVGVGCAAAAHAETDYSALIRDTGLSGAETTLSGIANPTPSDQFALGGVRFLGAVETAMQRIYMTELNQEMMDDSGLPLLRLPVGQSPEAAPFAPEVIEEIFEQAVRDLGTSLTPLEAIADADEVAVVIDTTDLWFDIDANGTRDAGEGFYDIVAPQLSWRLANGMADDFTAPVIRFDTADAAWLAAYAHLLTGVSQTVLALDPTEAIDRVTTSARALEALNNGMASRYLTEDDEQWVDLFAMFIHAMEGQPDVALSRAAHASFRGMIAQNQVFWSRVARESDNEAEWIPNKVQTSALPIEFPPETGETWRMVLAEAEAVLNGDLLIPHWRLGPQAGINLAEAMQNPPEIDIISILQGEGILPYAENGPLMTGASLRRFEQLLGGDAALFMVILN